MRKLLYLIGGVAFGVVIARIFRRNRPASSEAPSAPSSPGAEALRAQLAASRTGAVSAVDEALDAAADEAPAVVDVDEARRRVHGRARETVDEMRRSAESGL